MLNARVVNVIMVEEGNSRIYFTLEGIEVGRLVDGKRVKPKTPVAIPKPKGAVTKAPSPKDVKREQKKYNEDMMQVEKRIPLNE